MKIPAIIFVFGIFMLINLSANAQEILDTAAFSKIRKAELQNSHIPQLAHYLTDVAGPRLTSSPGFHRAANWAISTMKSWGLQNAALEPWGNFGKQWEIQDFNMFLRSPYPQPLRAYAQPWSVNTNGTIRGGIYILDRKKQMDTIYIAQHATEIKGKFVLITDDTVNTADNFKPTATRFADTALANLKDIDMLDTATAAGYRKALKWIPKVDILFKKCGALALISSSSGSINGSVFVQWFNGYSVPDSASVPRVSMALEDLNRLMRLSASGQKPQLSLNLQGTTSMQDTKGYNVIAEIPGTDPKLKSQLVMLGGHLDSWEAATGATDNGAGCLVMMEAMRLLDSLHLKPKRTIRVALWSGEEEGLFGSFNYVRNHFMDSRTYNIKPEQSKVSVYFNLDNGTGKIRGIYAQNNAGAQKMFEQWFKPFNDLGATAVTFSNTGSTDHLSFDWAGIPGFQFVQDPIDYEPHTHHTNLDDYDHLLMDDMKQAAIIVASFVYQASIRADMVPRKPLLKEKYVWDLFNN